MRVLVPMLSVALVVALSRHLGPPGLGRFTLAYSLLTIFNSIGPLGLNPVVTRAGARDRSSLTGTLNHALSLCAAVSALLTLGMIGTAMVMDYDRETRAAIAILSLGILPCVSGMLLDGAAMAIERVDQIAVGVLIEYVIKIGVGLALLLLGFGLPAVLLMAVVGKGAACMVQIVLLRRGGIAVGWGRRWSDIRPLLALVPTFLGISVFATLYWRIDVLMLSELRPVSDVGYYGAAYRLLEVAMVLPQSLSMSLYPQIAAASHNNPEALRNLGRAALRYLTVFSLPAAVCITVLAEPGLRLLYGKGFEVAAPTLAVLIFTLVPYGAVRYNAYVLVAANRQRIDLWLNGLLTAVNVLLNLVLIPRYGHLGAAAATLTAILLYALLQWTYLQRFLPGHGAPIPTGLPILLVTAATGGCVWLLREQSLAISIPAGCFVYVVTVFASGFLSDSELRILKLEGLLQRLRLRRN